MSTEVGLKVTDGKITTVELAGGKAGKVAGAMRPDGSSWVPKDPLEYETTYTATVNATADNGKTSSKTAKFTTMKRPGNRVGARLNTGDNVVYGQAMPIAMEFYDKYSVAEKNRAGIEKRLFVTSDPPQLGAWHWFGGGHLEYRPKDYWQPGTKVTVRVGLGGHPFGDGKFGAVDITSTFTIDTAKRVVQVDNASKTATAVLDGQPVKTMKVSLGKPATPSSSGTLVVMEKKTDDVFDSSTYGVPANSPDGYRTKVRMVQRLTWSGEYIHAAPWSVNDQGVRNVSHGCVNMSDADAAWVYNFTKIGDPVVVKGTERQVKAGDGWTAWALSWDEFVRGSALPPPAAPGAAPAPSPSK